MGCRGDGGCGTSEGTCTLLLEGWGPALLLPSSARPFLLAGEGVRGPRSPNGARVGRLRPQPCVWVGMLASMGSCRILRVEGEGRGEGRAAGWSWG